MTGCDVGTATRGVACAARWTGAIGWPTPGRRRGEAVRVRHVLGDLQRANPFAERRRVAGVYRGVARPGRRLVLRQLLAPAPHGAAVTQAAVRRPPVQLPTTRSLTVALLAASRSSCSGFSHQLGDRDDHVCRDRV